MLTLVIYDISNDRMRTKLSDHLKRYGLRRIQYSGFLGDLNSNDRIVLQEEVKRYVKGERDSIYIVPMCERCSRTCKIVSTKEISLHEEKVKII